MKVKSVLLGIVISIAAMAALGLGAPLNGSHTFPVACGTAATRIADTTSTGLSAFMAWNNSTTLVYVGGSDVDTSTKGMPICTTAATCFASSIAIDGGGAYCIVASGSTTIEVIGGK